MGVDRGIPSAWLAETYHRMLARSVADLYGSPFDLFALLMWREVEAAALLVDVARAAESDIRRGRE